MLVQLCMVQYFFAVFGLNTARSSTTDLCRNFGIRMFHVSINLFGTFSDCSSPTASVNFLEQILQNEAKINQEKGKVTLTFVQV